MANFIKCPKCKANIESDSYFCDQCGRELYICPKCRTFGKGKRCTQCGTELVKASSLASSPMVTPLAKNTVTTPETPPAIPPMAQQNSPATTIRPDSQQQPGHLVCTSPPIRLGLESGVIIGRRGHYPTVFAAFGDVSGNHAKIELAGQQWQVTDLGSSNGTFLNGNALTPNQPYPIIVGDILRFSTLDFRVEI